MSSREKEFHNLSLLIDIKKIQQKTKVKLREEKGALGSPTKFKRQTGIHLRGVWAFFFTPGTVDKGGAIPGSNIRGSTWLFGTRSVVLTVTITLCSKNYIKRTCYVLDIVFHFVHKYKDFLLKHIFG